MNIIMNIFIVVLALPFFTEAMEDPYFHPSRRILEAKYFELHKQTQQPTQISERAHQSQSCTSSNTPSQSTAEILDSIQANILFYKELCSQNPTTPESEKESDMEEGGWYFDLHQEESSKKNDSLIIRPYFFEEEPVDYDQLAGSFELISLKDNDTNK